MLQEIIAEFDTEKEANDFILSKTSSTQQSIPVTESMKETVMEGIPLFKILGERGVAEYELAQKVRDILKLRGIDKNFSVSNTDFGNSMYFTVYGKI